MVSTGSHGVTVRRSALERPIRPPHPPLGPPLHLLGDHRKISHLAKVADPGDHRKISHLAKVAACRLDVSGRRQAAPGLKRCPYPCCDFTRGCCGCCAP